MAADETEPPGVSDPEPARAPGRDDVLPDDTFARTARGQCDAPRFAPAARRTLEVFGAAVETRLLLHRGARQGVPTRGGRPAFGPERARRILADETVWRDAERGLALTPNRFPFAPRQALLWSLAPVREPGPELLAAACAFVARGAERDDRGEVRERLAIWNSVGAAASVPRAHVHLLEDRPSAFLSTPGERPWPEGDELIDECARADRPGLEIARLDLPVAVAVLRGPPATRALAAHRLLERRTTPAANLVVSADRCYVVPRSADEIPAPEFPHAVGGSEVAGRWCYADAEAFERATAAGLEQALRRSLLPVAALARR